MKNEISRREFNAALARYGMGLATIAGVLDPNYERHLAQLASVLNPAGCAVSMGSGTLDLASVLNLPVSRITDRRYPPILRQSDGKIANFLGHYYRTGDIGDSAGIDYGPVKDDTEIIPIASGVVTARMPHHKISGNFLHIHHGIGFISFYAHLKEMYVKQGDMVNRNTVIGVMGDTG